MEKPLSTPMIAFDYCEVIALAPSRDMLSRLAETAGLPVDTLVARYWQYRPEYDVGLPAADYWSRVMGTGSTTLDDARLAQLIRADIDCWMTIDPGTDRILTQLVETGAHLTLLSNLPKELAEAVRQSHIAAYFQRLVFSADIGVAKPDAEAFKTLLALEQARPESVVFIDDRADNIGAAIQLGIDSIHFVDASQLRAELQLRSVVGI